MEVSGPRIEIRSLRVNLMVFLHDYRVLVGQWYRATGDVFKYVCMSYRVAAYCKISDLCSASRSRSVHRICFSHVLSDTMYVSCTVTTGVSIRPVLVAEPAEFVDMLSECLRISRSRTVAHGSCHNPYSRATLLALQGASRCVTLCFAPTGRHEESGSVGQTLGAYRSSQVFRNTHGSFASAVGYSGFGGSIVC